MKLFVANANEESGILKQNPSNPKVGDKAAIKDLEAKGTAQGDVRKLKEAKTENYAIKGEVGKLLELKKQFAILKAMKGKIFIFRFCLYKQ